MGDKKKILVIEDDPVLNSALGEYLEETGREVVSASTVAEALAHLSGQIFDLVLADYGLPDADGLSVLDEIQARSPLTRVIIMTGRQDMELAARAFKKGIADLIPKPFQLQDLEARMADLDGLGSLPQKGVSSIASCSPLSAFQIVGAGPAMVRVATLINLVADKRTTVLLRGESGTGKELVARAIHQSGSRGKKAFVAINCGAIPETLLEDELFGHIRGAYTDARDAREGRIMQADGGTLFLDEIGNMGISLQAKLLRFLEERSFERLGSNQVIHVDIRVVAATNADLQAKVATGEFREDLFYRLNVMPIHLPPLRERKEDIPLLCAHFLERFCKEWQTSSKQVSPSALKLLMAYSWPGNIRELRNALELASVLSDQDQVLQLDHFPFLSGVSTGETVTVSLPREGLDLNSFVQDLERSLIRQSLERTGGNKQQAARLLKLKRTTLLEKLRRLGL